MSSWDFVVENIVFSYSSVNTFQTCPYSFKLTYLDSMPRENNFYAEFGTFIHQCFEEFFTNRLDAFELSDYYRAYYGDTVKTPAPEPPFGLGEKYKAQGQEFFDNFSFEREKYDVLLVEGKIDFNVGDVSFTARPDLVLQDKETGKTYLYDYKTSAPFRIDKRNGKETVDKEKLKGYFTQMYIYAYALREFNGMKIDEIILWFPRLDRLVTVPFTQEDEDAGMKWLLETVEKIKNEEDFPFVISQYFCDNLCSVRKFCEYR